MSVDEVRGITRWAPLAVVLSVVGGFVALSWYAYHAGMQSVKEEDLMVVEADKSPLKEKPADPGGMHFPNQDKTVFETFAGSGKQPPKVERVLPTPEEPLSKEVDSSDTSTWVNDKLHKSANAEQIIGKDGKKSDGPAKIPPATDRQVIAAQPDHEEEQSVTFVAPHAKATPSAALDNAVKASTTDKRGQPFAPEKVTSAAEGEKNKPKAEAEEEEVAQKAVAKEEPELEAKPEAKVETKAEAKKSEPRETEKPAEKAADPAPSSGGKAVIQLGAYRSEQEAKDAWDKMRLKQKELSDKKPTIIRADLGAKGIYFRLRVGGIAGSAEAKTICSALTAKGQPCLIPADK